MMAPSGLNRITIQSQYWARPRRTASTAIHTVSSVPSTYRAPHSIPPWAGRELAPPGGL
jgi:hypothetical protein